MTEISRIMSEIEDAPEFALVAIGVNRKENVESAFSMYRALNGVPDNFNMTMASLKAVEFMCFVWDVGTAYKLFGDNLLPSIGLGDTVVGAATVADLPTIGEGNALKFWNLIYAAMIFSEISGDCEKFVKWRLKEDAK